MTVEAMYVRVRDSIADADFVGCAMWDAALESLSDDVFWCEWDRVWQAAQLRAYFGLVRRRRIYRSAGR